MVVAQGPLGPTPTLLSCPLCDLSAPLSRRAAFLPSALAAGSLQSFGNSSVSSPVAMRMTFMALPMTSAGRFSPLGREAFPICLPPSFGGHPRMSA
jgi:hypothetical protein